MGVIVLRSEAGAEGDLVNNVVGVGGGGDMENVFSDDEPCFGRKLVGSIPQGSLIGLPLSNRLYNSKGTKEYKFYIIKAC